MDGPEVFGGHEALTRPALRWPYGNAKTTVGMGRRREVGMLVRGVSVIVSAVVFCFSRILSLASP